MTVSRKLYFGASVAMLATLGMGIGSWTGMGNVSDEVNDLAGSAAKKVYLSGDINTVTSDIESEERGVILAAARHDGVKLADIDKAFQRSLERLKRDTETMAPLVHQPEARQRLDEIKDSYSDMMANHGALLLLAARSDNEGMQRVFEEKVSPITSKNNKRAEALAQMQNQIMTDASDRVKGNLTHFRLMLTIAVLFGIATGLSLYWVIRSLNSNVLVAVDEMAKSSEQVKLASEQIATSSQSLAEASCEQASSIEETSASTEEIGSMTRRNSENSKSAAKLVDQSVQGFARSNRLLDEMLVAMEGISDSSDKISRIIKAIDEIAFQTNILALNAAVEAARAGEAGMGFAVVADEVRNLAQRCAQAAKDTAALIEDSIAKSRDGKSKVSETATSIRAVSEQAIQIKTLVDEVTLGSVEQTRGIEQISKALSQMDQATQSAAANAEQSASAARELDSQAEALHGTIDRVYLMFSNRQEHAVRSSTPAVRAKAKPQALREEKKFASSLATLGSAAGRSVTPTAPKSARQAYDEFPLEESFTEF